MTFKFRVFLILVVVVALSAALHLRQQLESTRAYLEQQLSQSAQDAAHHVGMWLQEPLAADDLVLVETRLNAFFDSGYYQLVRLTRISGEPLYERTTTERLDDTPAWFVRALPIKPATQSSEISDGWRRIASLEVRGNAGLAYAHLWRAALDTLSATTAVALVALILGISLLNRVLRPLREIEQQAEAICRREFPLIAERRRPREFATVVAAMNRMAQAVQRNFAALSQQAEKFREEAYLDAETGLGNRRAFETALDRELVDDQSPNGGVLLINLTLLESWRQSRGGGAVIEALRKLAALMGQLASEHHGSAFRPNLGEFALLLEMDDTDQLGALAADVAARVQALLGEDGVAVAATNYATGESRPQVMTRLDSALRHIGEGDNHRVEPLQQNVLSGGVLARRDQILALIGGEQLTLQAQPIIDPHVADKVLMHEVLLRFSGNAEGLTLVELLSEVRRFGLASALDQRVIELAWAHLAATPESLRLAINLMPATLADDKFLHQLEARFIRQPALARRLAFEIPELAVARSQPLVARLAALLNRYHCALTIEHVGVAAAPFIYLRDLKPQQIKIDGRYLRAIPDAREKWQFIRALIQMGQGLGIAVLAEQVESDEERRELVELGIDGLQGYGIARPQPLSGVLA